MKLQPPDHLQGRFLRLRRDPSVSKLPKENPKGLVGRTALGQGRWKQVESLRRVTNSHQGFEDLAIPPGVPSGGLFSVDLGQEGKKAGHPL